MKWLVISSSRIGPKVLGGKKSIRACPSLPAFLLARSSIHTHGGGSEGVGSALQGLISDFFWCASQTITWAQVPLLLAPTSFCFQTKSRDPGSCGIDLEHSSAPYPATDHVGEASSDISHPLLDAIDLTMQATEWNQSIHQPRFKK
jgi:hypothetical protein